MDDVTPFVDDVTPPGYHPQKVCETHRAHARVVAENFDGTLAYGHRLPGGKDPHIFKIVPPVAAPKESNMRLYQF